MGSLDGPVSLQPAEWLQLTEISFGELLGSGGFGSVYRGRLRLQDVAIKKMHIEGGGQLSSLQMEEFQKEVANLKELRHERLIRFIGIAFEPPVLCMVTELAPGGSLHSLLHIQKMALSGSRRRSMVLQIIEGVAFLHSHEPPFVHRDLKSANVVLDADLCAKLCDFGL